MFAFGCGVSLVMYWLGREALREPTVVPRGAATRSTGAPYYSEMQICLGDIPMKHPVKSDFNTAVTEAGVNVTFRPTNSIYSFYRLADSEDVARLGPVSFERVRHAGSSGDTDDYPSDKVQDMAQRIASEVAASVWSVQDEKEADKLTLRPPLIVGDEGD